jgi:hypothetical protein
MDAISSRVTCRLLTNGGACVAIFAKGTTVGTGTGILGIGGAETGGFTGISGEFRGIPFAGAVSSFFSALSSGKSEPKAQTPAVPR